MAVGDRIKRARNLRGMTQKELGIAIGFEEKSADIRIAQYESNTRTPKEELLRKIAEVLDVNYRSLYEPTLYAAEDVMYTLFELDEHYPGTRLYEVTDTTDPDFPEKHMAVSFRYRLLDDFLKEWQLRKKQLREGEITKEELLRKIAEVLDVNYRSLYEPTLYAAEDVMYTLFELDEHYPGTRLYEVTDTTDPDFPEKHMAVSFRYRLLDDFLKEWQLRKKQLREGEITKEEYLEWKLNWPQTADGCGRYEPKKKWRKE